MPTISRVGVLPDPDRVSGATGSAGRYRQNVTRRDEPRFQEQQRPIQAITGCSRSCRAAALHQRATLQHESGLVGCGDEVPVAGLSVSVHFAGTELLNLFGLSLIHDTQQLLVRVH